MAIDFLYPQYEVVRNNDRCINCRACERQCANEVHFWDADNNRMQADESKCVACHRCVALCPTRALKIVKTDHTFRENANWTGNNDSLCLLVQVESKTALDNLDEILDVEGIDGVFIGPADLSASLGYPDNAGHPEVQRIIETSIRRIRAAGKAAGFLAVAPDMAQQCLAWGANFVAVGVDTMLYSDALDQRLAMFKSGKNGPRVKGSY